MTRWLWRAFLALLAFVAICAELDRASVARPQLAILVPGPFRSFAQSSVALLALTTGDSATAQSEARRLVRRRPMPAEHLFTLAMAEMRAARPAAFAADFRAASTRGWRFAPLQVTAAQAALASGDVSGAANRVAALWAADAEDPSTVALTKALLAAPGGPEAFAVPLAQTRVWSGNFLASAAALGSAQVIARTVQSAQARGAHFDCDAVERLSGQLAGPAPGKSRETVACRP